MQRRGESGQRVKGRRTPRPKAHNARVPTTDLQEQVAALKRELKEAREQQTATVDVLKVISSSPGELEPVFKAMLENATRICDASYGVMFLCEGKGFRTAAMHNLPRAFAEERQRAALIEPIPIDPLARLAKTKKRVHIFDARTEAAYKRRFAPFVAAVEDGGVRTLLLTPLLREGELIGAFAIFRQEVRPFTGKQIELVDNFAAQAVIAIENARLLNELHQRTDDLAESLEQQTATSEVLKVISSSPGELEPVFNAMLANATRICEAKFGVLFLYEGDAFRVMALHGAPPAYAEERRRDPRIGIPQGTALARIVETRQTVQVADIQSEPVYSNDPQRRAGIIGSAGARTLIMVPMLKDEELIGAIAIFRQEIRPFTDKQIELVTNFASQAVIAIENTRLLSELRESLQQQTATADVLKVISSSAGELQPVFKTMLAKAVERCEASFGAMWLVDGDGYRTAAMHGELPQAYLKQWRSGTLHLPRADIPMVRAIRSRKTVNTPDMRKEKAYVEGDPLAVSAADIGGIRTLVTVPMLKEGEAVGVITIYRREVLPFNQKQIELVENFAAQAVIAIENTRLLNELRQRTDDLTESLEQQTATSEVLRIISSSPGDLEPVFEAMLQNSVRICEAGFGQMFLCEGDNVRLVAAVGVPTVLVEFDRQRGTFQPSPGGGLDGVMRTKQVVHIADLLSEHASYPPTRLGGARSYIAVPMLKENKLVGAIAIYRQEVRPFTDKQIELVQNFAAQAVIAIENTRLLHETKEALEQQRASAEVLNVISNSVSDAEPVFEKIVESCERIFATSRIGLNLIGPDGLVHAGAYGKFPGAEKLRCAAIRPARRQNRGLQGLRHGAAALRRPRSRCDLRRAGDDWLVLRQRDRAPEDLRRASGHRHRKRAPAQRASRISSAADRDCRCAQGHQQFARRTRAGVQCNAGERNPHL